MGVISALAGGLYLHQRKIRLVRRQMGVAVTGASCFFRLGTVRRGNFRAVWNVEGHSRLVPLLGLLVGRDERERLRRRGGYCGCAWALSARSLFCTLCRRSCVWIPVGDREVDQVAFFGCGRWRFCLFRLLFLPFLYPFGLDGELLLGAVWAVSGFQLFRLSGP